MTDKVISSLEFYKELAPYYDAAAALESVPSARLVFNLMARYLTPDIKTVLDVGIGTGLSSIPFKEAGCIITGIDGSEEMLSICRGKGIAQDLRQIDLDQRTAFPFETGTFDAVISAGTLYLLNGGSQRHVVEQMLDVTRPGGLCALNYETRSADQPFVRFNKASFDLDDPALVRTYAMVPSAICGILAAHNSEIIDADINQRAVRADGSRIPFETILCRKLG